MTLGWMIFAITILLCSAMHCISRRCDTLSRRIDITNQRMDRLEAAPPSTRGAGGTEGDLG